MPDLDDRFDHRLRLGAGAALAATFLLLLVPYLRTPASTDYVEGLIVRQADRLRAGAPIYETGERARRLPVPYPPIFAAMISLVPATPRSSDVARAVSALAALGTALMLALWARQRQVRGGWAFGALFLASPASTVGHYGLPDTLAVLLALAGLLLVTEATRAGRLALAAFLLVLAAQLKPSVVTVAAGIVLVLLVVDRRRAAILLTALAIFSAVAVTAWLALVGPAVVRDLLTVGYGGIAIGRASVALSGIAPALPLVVAQAMTARRTTDPTVRFLSLVSLVSWAVALLGAFKVGSSWRYFLEPWGATVAWLVALAPFETEGRLRTLLRAGLGWAALLGVLYAIAGWVYVDRKERALERIRPTVEPFAGRLHVEEPLVDYRWNGDLSFSAYEVRYLAESGRWDDAALAAEIRAGRYARMVFEFDPCDRRALHVLTRTQGKHDLRYGGAVRRAICARYVRVARVAPYSVYAPRNGPPVE